MMLDEELYFEYGLARDLGLSVGQVRSLPRREIVEWAAFYARRAAEAEVRRRRKGV